MARGNSYGAIVTMVRDECRYSSAASDNQDNVAWIKRKIMRHAIMLAAQYDWEFLALQRNATAAHITATVGANTYSFPTTLNLDKIEKVWVKNGAVWSELEYGITRADYSRLDSMAATPDKSNPALAWDWYDATKFELWPWPSADETIAFDGQRKITTFATTSDLCDLDDELVSLSVSAEILAANEQEKAAAAVSGAFNVRLSQLLRGNMSQKRITLGLGERGVGVGRYYPRRITYVR